MEASQAATRDAPAGRGVVLAYLFQVSTRDLARFGLLYLEQGRFGDRQVVPADWVRASFSGRPIGPPLAPPGQSYGFLWWIYDAADPRWHSFRRPVAVARGNRGHWLVVMPDLDLVIAHQVATGGVGLLSQARRRVFGSPAVSDDDLVHLVELVARACPDWPGRPAADASSSP